MTFTLPDDTRIDRQTSGFPNGPNQTSGQQISRSLWFRVNGGIWERSYRRSLHSAREWVECCETLADFRSIE